ncbi:hypothetical protein HNQ93_001753 [Hymenobacter luteus]|uniref:Uncharacterized protein n=2 Tax=Hymenobacter TaxID=89966 RepID=A0A7W9SZQ5_9BACT|nr:MULTISPECIES: hypothetical protein [Hymenobacter]MBB4600886.1 hypothetical protein [Hymenobacter latericoloratus]MBB6058907.1 hypothetical protein [Hymenobacter luteus]
MQFAQLYPYGLIRYTQTSFLELVTATEVHRIDFIGKISWHLQRGTHGPVSVHYDHPLLQGVQGPATTLMARATTRYITDASTLVADLQENIRVQAGEWYGFAPGTWAMWWHRLQVHNIVPDLTRTGGIILNSAPFAVAEAAAAICARHKVETYFAPPREKWSALPSAASYQLPLIGQNYVVARKFFVSTLYGNPSAKPSPRFLKKS